MTGREAVNALFGYAQRAPLSYAENDHLRQIAAGLTTWLDSVDELQKNHGTAIERIAELEKTQSQNNHKQPQPVRQR